MIKKQQKRRGCNASSKSNKRRSRSSRLLVTIPCTYCTLAFLHHNSISPSSDNNNIFTSLPMMMGVSGFTLSSSPSISDAVQKTKKCQGAKCKCNNNNNDNNSKSSSSASSAASTNSNSRLDMHDPRRHQHHQEDKMWRSSSGESFALHMASIQSQHDDDGVEHHQNDDTMSNLRSDEESLTNEQKQQDDFDMVERRRFLHTLITTTTTAATISTTNSASAYSEAYPQNLDFTNDDTSINLQSLREERISVQKSRAERSKADLLSNPLALRSTKDVLGSLTWGVALWFLTGSRSNPLVKPLANALYDEETKKGAWVKDRNEGLFAPFPAAFKILIGFVFLFLGLVMDKTLLFLVEENESLVLQLAGVSLIGGGSLELGRIASGEKMKTREDAERDELLREEYAEFASKRLVVKVGGSIHRSEVTGAFRRFYGKYRVDNEEYPLSDLEIERLIRNWNKSMGSNIEMTSAGFLKGVQLDSQTEVR